MSARRKPLQSSYTSILTEGNPSLRRKTFLQHLSLIVNNNFYRAHLVCQKESFTITLTFILTEGNPSFKKENLLAVFKLNLIVNNDFTEHNLSAAGNAYTCASHPFSQKEILLLRRRTLLQHLSLIVSNNFYIAQLVCQNFNSLNILFLTYRYSFNCMKSRVNRNMISIQMIIEDRYSFNFTASAEDFGQILLPTQNPSGH